MLERRRALYKSGELSLSVSYSTNTNENLVQECNAATHEFWFYVFYQDSILSGSDDAPAYDVWCENEDVYIQVYYESGGYQRAQIRIPPNEDLNNPVTYDIFFETQDGKHHLTFSVEQEPDAISRKLKYFRFKSDPAVDSSNAYIDAANRSKIYSSNWGVGDPYDRYACTIYGLILKGGAYLTIYNLYYSGKIEFVGSTSLSNSTSFSIGNATGILTRRGPRSSSDTRDAVIFADHSAFPYCGRSNNNENFYVCIYASPTGRSQGLYCNNQTSKQWTIKVRDAVCYGNNTDGYQWSSVDPITGDPLNEYIIGYIDVTNNGLVDNGIVREISFLDDIIQ